MLRTIQQLQTLNLQTSNNMTFPALTNCVILSMEKWKAMPNASVNSFGKIEEAVEGQLTFLPILNTKNYLYTTKASVIIINESL